MDQPKDQLSDSELVKQYQKGNAEAFEVFVMRHQDQLYRVCMAWLGDAALAEDAVQETFLRSYRGLTKFRFQAAPTTWINRVCRNVCAELMRRQRRLALVDDLPETVATQSMNTQLPDYLCEVLDALPQRQKEVVVLRLLEDFSVRDTAVILRCRQGTVKAHLAKAVANLRKLMAARNLRWVDLELAEPGND